MTVEELQERVLTLEKIVRFLARDTQLAPHVDDLLATLEEQATGDPGADFLAERWRDELKGGSWTATEMSERHALQQRRRRELFGPREP